MNEINLSNISSTFHWGPPSVLLNDKTYLNSFHRDDRNIQIIDFVQAEVIAEMNLANESNQFKSNKLSSKYQNKASNITSDQIGESKQGYKTDLSAQISALQREKKQMNQKILVKGRVIMHTNNLQKQKKYNAKRDIILRPPSLSLTDQHIALGELNLAELKPTVAKIPSAIELELCGKPRVFSPVFEKLSLKNPIMLKTSYPSECFQRPMPKFDSIIRELTAKSTDEITTIFATDMLMAQVMIAANTLLSWDLEVIRFQNFMFMDLRQEGTPNVDIYWVNENAGEKAPNDQDPSSIDSMTQLGQESTLISKYVSEMSRGENIYPHIKSRKSNFIKKCPLTPVFSYREWVFNDAIGGPFRIVTRGEFDCISPVFKPNEKKDNIKDAIGSKKVRCFGLLEPPGEKWEEKFGAQRGRIIMEEFQKSRPKFSKWAVMSYLSNIDEIKIFFVQRTKPNQNTRHQIFHIESISVTELLSKLGICVKQLWGIFLYVMNYIRKSVHSHVGILKNPNANIISLF